jgi:hypothetical protein
LIVAFSAEISRILGSYALRRQLCHSICIISLTHTSCSRLRQCPAVSIHIWDMCVLWKRNLTLILHNTCTQTRHIFCSIFPQLTSCLSAQTMNVDASHMSSLSRSHTRILRILHSICTPNFSRSYNLDRHSSETLTRTFATHASQR